MGLKLNTASSGSVTIEPTNTASNYTLTVPAQTGTVIASDSSGNVGIGTSSPTTKLDVVGTGNYDGVIRVRSAGTNTPAAVLAVDAVTNAVGYVGTQNNLPFQFRTNDIERMRIDTSGNLLINTTATSGLGGFRFGSGGTGCIWISNATADGNTHASFQTASVQKGYIATSGGSTIYSTSSDYRLKENIQPMTGALNKVMQLKPVTYRWIEEQVDSQGFIAHELQEVVPQCVLGEKDAVDAEGKPVYQGIDTSFLVATLTAAIQELNAKVDAQAAEIALLKGQA